MFSFRLALGRIALAVALAAGTVCADAVETRAQGAPAQPTDSDLLTDFNFYVMTANIQMAQATARALLDRKLDPQRFVGLVEDSPTMQDRFDRAYRRALVMPQLEALAADLYKLYETGRLQRARDPNEITKNIELLAGAPRAVELGSGRLEYAGEYAVPQMLDVLLHQRGPLLQTQVQAVWGKMGANAVQPLSAALNHVDPATQEAIAKVLGRLKYPSALPYLVELHQTTQNPNVRAAAEKSIQTLGGEPQGAVSDLYRQLGEQYYSEAKSLTSFPTEDHQLLWDYTPQIGLQPSAINTRVYHEAQAMRLSERALQLNPSDQEAISLWLASNFSRELDTPEGYDNPAYPADGPEARRDAMYYAVAAGAEATQRVLARALRDLDTPLARRAIEALSRGAGVSGLVGPGGVPLVDALSYPDRRVRYEAALALGRAKPREFFEGAERVVPTLASVIRDAGSRYAVVVATDLERQQALRKVLEGLGYQVLPPSTTLEGVSRSISEVPGIDVVITDLTADSTVRMIDEVRRTSRLQATPVLGIMAAPGIAQYGAQYEGDRLTALARQGASDEQITEGIRQLVERGSGAPITEDEALGYASSALNVLHDLAIASGGGGGAGGVGGVGGASAFDIADSAIPLIGALTDTKGDLKIQVADVLSYIGQQRAQVALMDAVMNAPGGGGERLVLMTKMNNSAKRFGNMLEDRQVRWLLEQAQAGSDEEATLAASLIGALNLPNAELVPLILRGRMVR